MIQSEKYVVKLDQGDSINTSTLNSGDTGHTYSIHSMIVLGAYENTTDMLLNGIDVRMPGAFIYNLTSISTLDITASTYGVLLVGSKTKRQLFN